MLEQLSIPADTLPENVVTIIYAMSNCSTNKSSQKTFGDTSKVIFNTIMSEALSSNRVDVAFDIYCNKSIKNIDRAEERGATRAIQFKIKNSNNSTMN